MTLGTLWRQVRWRAAKTPLRPRVQWWRHRGIGDKDVFVASYPRSGSTWLRFLLAELLTESKVSFDSVNRDLAGVEVHRRAPRLLPDGGRLLKTHEPFRRDYRRAIHLVRDPRDVLLSEFRFLAERQRVYSGDRDEFFRDFIRGAVNPYGSWAQHVSSWLDAEEDGSVELITVRYEDLRANTMVGVQAILHFLGVVRDAAVVSAAIEANSLEAMRTKEAHAVRRGDLVGSESRFIGEGISGHWRGMLSPPQESALARRFRTELLRLGYSTDEDRQSAQ